MSHGAAMDSLNFIDYNCNIWSCRHREQVTTCMCASEYRVMIQQKWGENITDRDGWNNSTPPSLLWCLLNYTAVHSASGSGQDMCMFVYNLAAKPLCIVGCYAAAWRSRAAGARGEGLANLALINDWIFLEFHYGFRWYDRSCVAWADFVTRMAVVHVRRCKSHEYRWNESLQWNLIGYSTSNQVQGC